LFGIAAENGGESVFIFHVPMSTQPFAINSKRREGQDYPSDGVNFDTAPAWTAGGDWQCIRTEDDVERSDRAKYPTAAGGDWFLVAFP
jgi:hypothetical protein